MILLLLGLASFAALSIMAIFSTRKRRRVPEIYRVSEDTPLPLIDGYFVFNGDQVYYPESRRRYLATCDEWIDISENFRGAVHG